MTSMMTMMAMTMTMIMIMMMTMMMTMTMMMAHTDRLPACNKTYSGDNDDDDDIGDDNDDHVMKTLGTTSQITPIFSYASSSTLHPRQ